MIKGFLRLKKNKSSLKKLRNEGKTPGVLYGNKQQFNFYVPTFLLRDVVYTPKVHFVSIDIEGKEYRCILQDIQFHPVNDMILHIDLMELVDDKKIKMDIPIAIAGNSPGVAKGGQLAKRLKKLKVIAYPRDMPSDIIVDVSSLDLGKTVRVKELKEGNYSILNSKFIPIVSVEIPRALRSKAAEKDSN